MCYFVVWDLTRIGVMEEDGQGRISWKNHSVIDDTALMLGDFLLARHLLSKWYALKTRDISVSLFLETHVHIGGPHHDESHHCGHAAGADDGELGSAKVKPG